MKQIDGVAGGRDLSRQAIIPAILKQVLDDQKFILKIE